MKKLLTATLMIVSLLLTVNSAQATTFTFGDDTIYWDTWANGTADDKKDSIGRPDMAGGGGTLANGILTDLYFTYTKSMNKLELGDLFIDATSDGYWDYILSNGSVYSLNLSATKGDNDAAYENTDEVGWNEDYRNDHPYAVTDEYLNNYGSVIGKYSLTESTGKIDFAIVSADLKLALGYFTVSLTQNCANDVVTEKPTPEPATMLLLGSGLVGLAGLRRKRFLRK